MKKGENHTILIIGIVAVVALVVLSGERNAPTAIAGNAFERPGQIEAPSPRLPATCTDTDGGINYPTFGYVYGRNAFGSNYRYNDQCGGSTLWERYCIGSSPAVQQYACPNGCSDGRCNPRGNDTNTTQCQDRRDNDADGLIDYPSDPGCVALTDNDEYNAPPGNGTNTTQCNDRLDNDQDGLTDYPADPGCASANDATETNAAAACDNGIDESNDADTLADFRLSGGDPGCLSATDSSEVSGQCDDRADNDLDGTIDYPSDTGCFAYVDNDESR